MRRQDQANTFDVYTARGRHYIMQVVTNALLHDGDGGGGGGDDVRDDSACSDCCECVTGEEQRRRK
eukprot:2610704-Rhodomonas_salina.2